jgi:hypothetical protein
MQMVQNMLSFFKKTPQAGSFWDWFKLHRARYEADMPVEGAHAELADRLRQHESGMTYELVRRDDVWELQISADGEPSLIGKVRELVDSAPEMPGWRVVPFRQPRLEPAVISFLDRDLTVDNILFSIDCEYEGGDVDVTLYIDGLTNDNYRHMAHCAMLLMESLVGELPIMTQVHEIEYASLPEKENAEEVRPLRDLPAALGTTA